jgi:hypothetical protein
MTHQVVTSRARRQVDVEGDRGGENTPVVDDAAISVKVPQ